MPQVSNFVNVLVFRNFASYFDRKVFYYDTPTKYRQSSLVLPPLPPTNIAYHNYTNINFNPADGVDTILVLNGDDGTVTFDLAHADYVVIHSGYITNTVYSRWYVMDVDRNAKGIYTLTLRRDVVAEVLGPHYLGWDAPFFVERAMLPTNVWNPLLVLDEGMNFNQIKQGEELLFDDTKTAWVVGYFDNKTPDTPITINSKIPVDPIVTLSDISNATGISVAYLTRMLSAKVPFVNDKVIMEWYFNDSTGVEPFMTSLTHKFTFSDYLTMLSHQKIRDINRQFPVGEVDLSSPSGQLYNVFTQNTWMYNGGLNVINLYDNYLSVSDIETMLTTVISNQFPTEEYADLEMQRLLQNFISGKKLYYGGNYYDITLQSGDSYSKEVEATIDTSTTLRDMVNASKTAARDDEGTLITATSLATGKIFFKYDVLEYGISLNKTTSPNFVPDYSTSIPSSHNVLNDGSYSMFAFPLNSVYVDRDGTLPFDLSRCIYTQDKEISFQLANAIANELGPISANGHLIDLQILPFAPYTVWKNSSIYTKNDGTTVGVIDISGLTLGEDYEEILDDNSNVVGFIFFEKKSTYSSYIPVELEPKYNIKEESNTTMIRLCSPTYSGVFEFNIAKIGEGTNVGIYNINYDITYKPFNPFIRVSPDFSRLYGTNYMDSRGLICSGDFSLPMVSDAWVQYENNNKTYGQIFAREIQNLEVKQQVERFKEPFAVMSGTAVGAGAGALTGAKMSGGNPYAALAGAVMGAGTGLVGGLLDISQNEKLRREEKRYMFDRFNLNIASIKALPQSLAKNSSLTAISKYVPFLEFYDCTEEEHEIFQNRIKYNGMTIGAIGNINQYVNQNGLIRNRSTFNYFKGQLIHATDVEEDNHFINVLYDEFEKGVYI